MRRTLARTQNLASSSKRDTATNERRPQGRLFASLAGALTLLAALSASAGARASQGGPAARSVLRTTASASTFVIAARPLQLQAPADVYFGKYKLSNLGVRNAIHDMTVEGNSPLALPGQLQRIEAVESALAVWVLQYPHDPWLPSSLYWFAQFLHAKHVAQYDHVAYALLDELTLLFPDLPSGRSARRQLAGFTFEPGFDIADDSASLRLPRVFGSQAAGAGEKHRRFF
jgi:hypothetical protein